MGVRTVDFTIAGNYALSAFAREMTELSEAPATRSAAVPACVR